MILQENKIHVFKDIYYEVPQSTAARPIETLFTDLPQAEQYWRRQDDFVINKIYPNIFFDYNPHLPEKKRCRINATKTHYIGDRLVSLSIEDTQKLDALLKREVKRMQNGIFIMNNGIRIYFPGVYYGFLQWCKLVGVSTNGGYGDHRRYQREYACQRQKCIEDEYIDSLYCHKIKKCGLSQQESAFDAIESITNKQFISASMSKNHDTCKAANFAYFLYAFKNLPKILIPSIEQKSWAATVQKLTIKSEDPDVSLQNIIVAVSTVADALDGMPPLKRVKLSEMPKMDLAEEILKKSREQTKLQQTKVGITIMESYPPEDDTKSFKFCRNMYTKDCMDLDERGYPKNKTIPLYIGLLEATNGTHDIYGEPDRKKAVEIEIEERKKCDTPAKLQARQRQYHMNAAEGWQSGGGGSVYNNIALAEQKATIEDKYKFGDLNYRLANLQWTAGFGSAVRIEFLSLEDIKKGEIGKWRIYCSDRYISENTNRCFSMPRRIKKIGGEKVEVLQPPDDVIHVAGTDPVDYGFVSEMGKKQSKNASIIRNIEGNLISVFHWRSEDPDENLEDFAKEMICFGTYSIVEGNRKNAVTTLEKLGMYYFMLIRHSNGQIVPYGQSIKIKHVSSGKDVKSKYIELVTKHIKNNIEYFQDVPILESHMDFEPNKTQEYDLAVADGLSFLALDSMQEFISTKKIKQDHYGSMGDFIKAFG